MFWFIGGASGFVQVWVSVIGGASGFVQVWVSAVGGVVGFVSCGVVQPETPLPVELWGAMQPETPLLARCGLLWGVLVHRWCQWFRAGLGERHRWRQWFRAGLGERRRWCRWFRFVWCCATRDASASGIMGRNATRDASVGSLWPVMGCFGSSVVPVVSCRFGCASAVVSLVSFRVVLCNPRRLCRWACGAQCNPRRLCWWAYRVQCNPRHLCWLFEA